jgi:hypothetical protein
VAALSLFLFRRFLHKKNPIMARMMSKTGTATAGPIITALLVVLGFEEGVGELDDVPEAGKGVILLDDASLEPLEPVAALVTVTKLTPPVEGDVVKTTVVAEAAAVEVGAADSEEDSEDVSEVLEGGTTRICEVEDGGACDEDDEAGARDEDGEEEDGACDEVEEDAACDDGEEDPMPVGVPALPIANEKRPEIPVSQQPVPGFWASGRFASQHQFVPLQLRIASFPEAVLSVEWSVALHAVVTEDAP